MTAVQGVIVQNEVCVGCGVCIESCPTDVLRVDNRGKAFAAFADDCQYCFLCVFDCPVDAISITIEPLSDLPRWWDHWLGSRLRPRV